MNIIQVRISTNAGRQTKTYEDNITIRAICEAEGIDYTTGGVSLDGTPLVAGEFDKTLADFNIAATCNLSKVVKQEAA